MKFPVVEFLKQFWFASIRRQITLSFVAATGLVLLLSGYGILQQERSFLRKQSIEYAQGLAHTVSVSSTSWVIANDVVGLQEVMKSIGQSRGLRYVMAFSPEGLVLASSDPKNIGLVVSDDLSRSLLALPVAKEVVLIDSEGLLDVAAPVMAHSRLVGWVRIGFGREDTDRNLRHVERLGYLMMAASFIATLLVALALSGRLTGRLQRLVMVANQIHAGQRSVRVKVVGTDEVSVLANNFNNMLDKLEESERGLLERGDQLAHSNADLERFAYSVSHDMRQPLRAVSGHLQLLEHSLKGKLDEDDRENMKFALEGARRMDSMIVSLLDYSRVGRKTEAKKSIASRESLDEAMGFLEPLIEEAKAQINLNGEWPQIFASRDELTRLFQNLIGNALKFRDAAHPAVVEIESSVQGETWRVSVRDHGVGIDPQQIDRLFQFFSRLQSRARFEGTGMGLALCRRIVEHHNGRIWVESAGEGKGCTFVFELPLQIATEQK